MQIYSYALRESPRRAATLPARHTQLITLDTNDPTPLVTQLRELLASRIDKGILRAGSRLPSVRQMAKECGVSTLTVTNAYNRLVAEGYVEARRASGYYVIPRPPAAARPRQRSLAQIPVDASWLLQHVFENDSRHVVNAGCGWLPESLLDSEGIRHGFGAMAKRQPDAFARYGNPRGFTPLVGQVQMQLMARNIDVRAEQIVLTHGASHALDLVARTLLQAGDTVLIEDPGYCNLLPSLAALDVRVVGVPRLIQGPDVQALEALAERHRPKAFFINTNLQNPTGTSCNPATLFQILRLAESWDFLVVEDDIFADLLPSAAPSLASLDQLKRVIHIGSFSKTISPALRVGFVAAGEALADRLVSMKMTCGLTTSEISEQMVHAILVDGRRRAHLARLREALARKQERVCHGLTDAGMELFHRPIGGLFVWARFRDAILPEDIAQQAAEIGIVLAPGRLFSPSKEASPWLRFNVGHSDHAKLFEFLALRGHGERA